MLALLVWLSARAGISNPLKRLVEAIDDVTHGDLGRVILRERDDEIGDLAERFNEMTYSLREAREEILARRRRQAGPRVAPAPLREAGHHRPAGGRHRARGGHAAQRHRRPRPHHGEEGRRSRGGRPRTPRSSPCRPQRITKIIQQLLDFARPPGAACAPRSISTSSARTASTSSSTSWPPAASRRAAPLRRRRPRAPTARVVLGDADQLQQVCSTCASTRCRPCPTAGASSSRPAASARRAGPRDRAARPLRGPRGRRHRRRHPRGGSRAHLRAVLLDQATSAAAAPASASRCPSASSRTTTAG